jgi:hypothetical protein
MRRIGSGSARNCSYACFKQYSHASFRSAGARKPAMQLLISEREFDTFIEAEINHLYGAAETYQSRAILLRCVGPGDR